MASALPAADLYALTARPDVDIDLGGRELKTSAIDRVARAAPGATLALMPFAWRHITVEDYDIVVTSSHAFARHFSGARRAPVHLSYVHAPLRYAWDPELDDRLQRHRMARAALPMLRRADRSSVSTVSEFAANSAAVRNRIRRYYDRDARVIHPPVDVEFFGQPVSPPADLAPGYLLSVSRLVPYKRHDLAIQVAAALDRPLVVAGAGPDEDRLRALATATAPGRVEFRIAPSRDELRALYQHAAAVLFLAIEDFGIVPVEAQAAGTPVIAVADGGATDTIVHGYTGTLAASQALLDVVRAAAQTLDRAPDPAMIQAHAVRFSTDRFRSEFGSWVHEYVGATN